MQPLFPPQASEKLRLKVYEFKNNDWVDEGTGICRGIVKYLYASIKVESEDRTHVLFNMSISKDSEFRKQKDTLIVWTHKNGLKMALSSGSVSDCFRICKYVNEVQRRLQAGQPFG